jgi:glycosyltransferase involved in cell wall biosynthesis
MRFCMVATFYPPYHFGGDAVYVYRLSNALARIGHHVDVLHDADAFYVSGGRSPRGEFEQHPNVHVRTMRSAAGMLSPLITHQTAQPWLKKPLRQVLEAGSYDVIHFHNISLIGPAAFRLGDAVKLYTLHEHWLLCPMHVLWKFDREPCTAPSCFVCTLRGRRPPQLWRYTGLLDGYLASIDRFLSPSRFTREKHLERFNLPITVLPHFVPEPKTTQSQGTPARPYFLFVGRLTRMKGLQTLIPVFRSYPDADLLVVGSGELEAELRASARNAPNIKFLGALPPDRLEPLYRNAIALIMPSVGYEAFGIVLLEALANTTPVIVRVLGAMPEVVEASGGGLVYRDDTELVDAMRTLQMSPEKRARLGALGYGAFQRLWSEQAHLSRYFEIIEAESRKRAGRRE